MQHVLKSNKKIMLSEIMKRHIPVDVSKMRKKDFLKSQRENEKKKLKQIEKKHGWKEVLRCPLCKSRKYEIELAKYKSPLVKCGNCQLRYHKKIAADLDDVYGDEKYVLYTKGESREHFLYRKNRFGKERVQILKQVCGDLSKKRILDVGCGNGFFLAAAKEESKYCLGSEISKINIERGRKNTGLPIYSDRLENFPEKDFDIIVSFDVLEHVENPVEFVQSIKNLLKPKGCIFMYTPNFDSFSIKVMGEYSSLIDPTAHVILFNRTSIEKLAELMNMKVAYYATRGMDINSILSYQYHLTRKHDPFLKKWLNELQAMIDHAECGDSLRVILVPAV